jgi:hypothetical protein
MSWSHCYLIACVAGVLAIGVYLALCERRPKNRYVRRSFRQWPSAGQTHGSYWMRN